MLCKNKQEQSRILDLDKRLEPEPKYLTKIKKDRKDIIQFKRRKEKLKIKSFREYDLYEFYCLEYGIYKL